MGTWGAALYSDDMAADVRDGYRELIGDGLPGPQATEALLKQWGDALADAEQRAVFWLALAATQWRCGRLEERVKAEALTILKGGSDLRRWREDAGLLKRRQAVLAKLQAQLCSPQPREKRIPRTYRETCDWEAGEIIGYRGLSGDMFILRVVGHQEDKGGTRPICELLDWSGTEAPPAEVLARLPVKGTQFILAQLKEKDMPAERVMRLGVTTPSRRDPDGYTILIWSHLDETLREYLAGL